jgi:iron complex transport system ATP-binding protein
MIVVPHLSAEAITLAGRLADISLRLNPGEVTAICGPNGAGKSSLLALLAGLLAPDSGRAVLGESDLTKLSGAERARTIGYLPQAGEIAWDVSVETLVSLGRLPWPDDTKAQVSPAREQALAAMDLLALRARPVMQLSGGERARVLLARVLAGEPQWLLADEPLAMLDLAHAAGLMRRLQAQARSGRGVAVVLHDLPAAMNWADRVIVLDHGHLAADGPPDKALSAAVITRVWGVKAQWLGEAGARALAVFE